MVAVLAGEPPQLTLDPVQLGAPGDQVAYTVRVGDGNAVRSLVLYYRETDEDKFQKKSMKLSPGKAWYYARIDSSRSSREIQYYIELEDVEANKVYLGLPFEPLVAAFSVEPAKVVPKRDTKTSSTAEREWQSLFLDTFDDGVRSWVPPTKAKELKFKVRGSRLEIKNQRKEEGWDYWMKSIGRSLPVGAPFSVQVSMSMSFRSKPDWGNGMAIGVRRNDIFLRISPNGWVKVDERKNGRWKSLQDWKKSAKAKLGVSKNLLRIDSDGSGLKFFLNGSQVFAVEDMRIGLDSVGFVVGYRSTMRVHSVEVFGYK
jgi:hypothetical protein